jgi:flagellar hook assembly protein FlgD
MPSEPAIGFAAPNPTASGIEIGFALSEPGMVHFDIVNVGGRVVASLPPQRMEAGRWTMNWDGRNESGALPAGVYWARMSVGAKEIGRAKFVLMH